MQNPWERGRPARKSLKKCGQDARVPGKAGGFAITSNDEYKKIDKNLLWYPVKSIFYWKGLRIFYLIMATIGGVLSGIGYYGYLKGGNNYFAFHVPVFNFITYLGFSPIVGSVLVSVIMTVIFSLARHAAATCQAGDENARRHH